MRDEHSLEQILEAMLTVALEPISARSWPTSSKPTPRT